MPVGTQAARQRSVTPPVSHAPAAVVAFPKTVGCGKDIAAGLTGSEQPVVQPRSLHPRGDGRAETSKSPSAERRLRRKASPRFRCPHCGGRDSLGVEVRQAKSCQQQLHRCADCLQAIPRHLAERWLGLSFEEARSQWRGFRALAAGKALTKGAEKKPRFQADSFALLRYLRQQAQTSKKTA